MDSADAHFETLTSVVERARIRRERVANRRPHPLPSAWMLGQTIVRRGLGAMVVVSIFTACDVEEAGVPPGKLALVGTKALGPEDVAGAQSQLGAYGQLRFRGEEGHLELLESLIMAELLAQEADAVGLSDDPRVQYAVIEEIAEIERSAELERRVPRSAVAQDEAALRAYYDAHPEAFTEPEKRSARGVVFSTFEEAEQALEALHLGTETLGSLGKQVTTKLRARDDHEFPLFHPFLYAEGLQEGELLEHPVVVGEKILVGRVHEIEPATLRPFDDERVRDELIEAIRAPRVKQAEAVYLEELRARYPSTSP